MTPSATPIRWPAETLWQAVEPLLPAFTVEVLPEIDSSNTELMRRLKAGRPEPILLVAEHQTAGRGRLGRHWHSTRGDSLTFSLGLPMQPVDWSGLSLAVGISLAESLDPTLGSDHHIGLKWPNDLWLCTPQMERKERKLAGILVETASFENLRYVVIGIGINIRPVALPPAADPAIPHLPPAMEPGALQDLLPGIDAAGALLRVVPPLVQAVLAFGQFGFAPFQARFARRDVLAGRAVQVSGGKSSAEGTAHGVGENGALRVHTAAGMKEITSSEVSVRPVSLPATQAAGAARPRGEDSRPC